MHKHVRVRHVPQEIIEALRLHASEAILEQKQSSSIQWNLYNADTIGAI